MRRVNFIAVLVLLAVSARADSKSTAKAPPVKITDEGSHLHVDLNGTPFTDYWYGKRDDRPYTRPFFYPVLASDGTPVTSDQFAVVKGDHPHHQSLWVAHSDVSGIDHWSLQGKPPARQKHVRFETISADGFVEDLEWEGKDTVLLEEKRTVRFTMYDDGSRGVDLSVSLTPRNGKVILHDVKDAGLCSVRVAKEISDTVKVSNSAGQVGEKECWGKSADWCDESGTIGGKPYGIAMFDSPANPRHPTHWHVRDYGLMSANPFGLHDFDPKKYGKGAGDMTLDNNKTVTFRYLVVVHPGDAKSANLDEKYKAFASGGSR